MKKIEKNLTSGLRVHTSFYSNLIKVNLKNNRFERSPKHRTHRITVFLKLSIGFSLRKFRPGIEID